MTVFGSGKQTRDYVFVGDVVDAFLAAATAHLPPPGGVTARTVNIGTGILMVVLMLIVMFLVDPVLTLLAVGSMPLVAIVSALYGRSIRASSVSS